ncbi:MAG TPA: hypothetical protein VH186_39030 [Chloroflexia bacterium]|nr:hypothetical protein [Chloroflexia bacterium]
MERTDENLARLLANFAPSADALLLWLQPRVDDRLLREIAMADYGDRAEEHFQALKIIRDQLIFPGPGTVPWEVIQLDRWSEPENPEWKPGLTGPDGHLMRAFCCAVLVRTYWDSETGNFDTGADSTLAQLVASLLVLGPEAVEVGLQLLSWRVLNLEDRDMRPFYALAILLLAASLYPAKTDGPLLGALAEWVIEEGDWLHSTVCDYYGIGSARYRWIVGVGLTDGIKERTWVETTRKVLLESSRTYPPETEEILKLIGEAVTA